jgi:predicted secreted protein
MVAPMTTATSITPDTAHAEIAPLPTPALRQLATEIRSQTNDRFLTRQQRAFVKNLVSPYANAIAAELERRGEAK